MVVVCKRVGVLLRTVQCDPERCIAYHNVDLLQVIAIVFIITNRITMTIMECSQYNDYPMICINKTKTKLSHVEVKNGRIFI